MTLVEGTGDVVEWRARCPCGDPDVGWRAQRMVVIERGYSYHRVQYDIDCPCVDEVREAA